MGKILGSGGGDGEGGPDGRVRVDRRGPPSSGSSWPPRVPSVFSTPTAPGVHTQVHKLQPQGSQGPHPAETWADPSLSPQLSWLEREGPG